MSASGVNLSNTYAPLRTPSVWAVGDSHTVGAAPGGGGVTYDAAVFSSTLQGGLQYQGGSWLPWALFASGTRWTIRGFSAAGGLTAAQILTQCVPLVIAAATKGDTVVVHAGTNGTVLADVISIHNTLRSAGLTTVAVTIPPNSGGTVSGTLAFNMGLQRWAAANRIPIADVHSAVVNPATGAWAAAYVGDGTHGNQLGCQVAGQTIATVLNTLLAWPEGLINHNAAMTGSNQSNPLAQNALTNGVDYGTLSGLGTSTIAQGNVAAFAGGKGYVFTRGDTDINAKLTDWTLVAGHTYRVGMALSATPAGGGSWGLRMESNTTGLKILWGIGYPATYTVAQPASRFFCEFTLPTLPDYVYRAPRVNMQGVGTVLNIGEITMLDLTAMGLA